MGQKVRPTGFRIGVTEDWRSRWFAKKADFGTLLLEDQEIRQFIAKKFGFAGIGCVEIERTSGAVLVIIRAEKPGLIIGSKGANIDRLKEELSDLTDRDVDVKIIDVKEPKLDAQLVAEAVANDLKKRQSFRRVLKKCLDEIMSADAKGCKIQVSGRLGGHEMARTEYDSRGSIPLHTLRADIDYGFAEAHTTYGSIGCKVWVFRDYLKPGEKKRYRT